MWSRLVAVGLPFFRSEKRRLALGGIALLVTLLLTINGINVANSYAGRGFMTALAERHGKQFFVFAGIFAGVFAVSTVVEVFARYVEQRLGLFWREWLTRRLLNLYLANRTYLRLAGQCEIDNPDGRIGQDVQTFTATTQQSGEGGECAANRGQVKDGYSNRTRIRKSNWVALLMIPSANASPQALGPIGQQTEESGRRVRSGAARTQPPTKRTPRCTRQHESSLF